MATRRTPDEPAYVLHRYDWSESSLILETFTRGSGRVALVAKGARRPTSNFRPVLLPLQPLRLSFGGDGEIRTLKSAEWVGGHVMPTGDALLSGYYLNELLMRLLARDDPHPGLFDAYADAVRVLAGDTPQLLEPALRAFELVLLREAGLLPALDAQTANLLPLQDGATYRLVPEAGLVPESGGEGRPALQGRDWLRLDEALAAPGPFAAVLQAVAPSLGALKPQLRTLLHYHCGVAGFKTRQLMIELQSL